MLTQYFQEKLPVPSWFKDVRKVVHFDHLEWSWILNYDAHNCIDFHDGISVLHAKNAGGKTNFLEVLCLALFGEGFPSRYNKHYSAGIICDKKPAGTMASTLLKFTLKRTKCVEEIWTLKRVLKSNNDRRAVNFHEVSLTSANEVIQGQGAVSAWIEEHIGSVAEFLATAMHADGDFFSLDKGQRALLEAPFEAEARAILQEVLQVDTKCAITKCTVAEQTKCEERLAELIAQRELLEKRPCTPCTPCTPLEAGQDTESPLETTRPQAVSSLQVQLALTIHALSKCDERLTGLHSFSDLAEADLESESATETKSATGSDKSSGTATGSDKSSGTATGSDKSSGTATGSDKSLETATGTATGSDKSLGTATGSDKSLETPTGTKSATGTLKDTTVEGCKRPSAATSPNGDLGDAHKARSPCGPALCVSTCVSTHPLFNHMNIYEDMDVIRSLKGESTVPCAIEEWSDDRFIGFYPDAEERLLTNKKLLAVNGARLKQATKELTAAKKVTKTVRQHVPVPQEHLIEQIRDKETYLQECAAYPYNDQCSACANHPWRLRANAYRAELPLLHSSLKAIQKAEERAVKEKEVREAAVADVQRLEAEIAGLKAGVKRAEAEVIGLERQLGMREEFAAYCAERERRRVAAAEAEEQLKRSWYAALYSYRMAIAVQYRSLKEERGRLVEEKERIVAAIDLIEEEEKAAVIRAAEAAEEEARVARLTRLELDREIWRLQCAVKGVSEEHEMASVMLGLLDGYRAWYLAFICSRVNELLHDCRVDWADGWLINSRVVEKASGYERFFAGVAIRAVLIGRYDQLFIDGLSICDAERFAEMPAFVGGLLQSSRSLHRVNGVRSIYVMSHQEFIGVSIPLGGSEGLAHIQHPPDATLSISVPSKKGRPPKAKEVTVTKE